MKVGNDRDPIAVEFRRKGRDRNVDTRNREREQRVADCDDEESRQCDEGERGDQTTSHIILQPSSDIVSSERGRCRSVSEMPRAPCERDQCQHVGERQKELVWKLESHRLKDEL